MDTSTRGNRTLVTSLALSSELSRLAVQIWASVILLISFAGIICNAFLFLVIARSKRLRAGTGFLILNLVFACLLASTVNYPLHALMVVGKTFWFPLPGSVCNYTHYIMSITAYANNWFEAFLGINRFVATVCPHGFRSWTSARVCLVISIFCWTFGAVTTLPFCFGMGAQFLVSDFGQCRGLVTSSLGVALLSLNTYLPYGIVAIAIVPVLSKLFALQLAKWRSRMIARPEAIFGETSQQRALLRRRLTVARMLLLSFLFCLACNLPLSIASSFFTEAYGRIPLLSLWLRVFLVFQYAATPVIFFACNDDYRHNLRRLISNPQACSTPTKEAIELRTIPTSSMRHL
ncbi:hypothetical protein BV898_14205 [Hypsibius exemplaris]|uniref:G-protein coupled receptors family 1 profile domain-containing protein n=1 Tax=Hypsibius exemplaris TaxID=2072580 RepID=A0A1W0W8E7_HYPEX|nr:hypothetical protein BV898_14205 [Hypsibius exemplaris]